MCKGAGVPASAGGAAGGKVVQADGSSLWHQAPPTLTCPINHSQHLGAGLRLVWVPGRNPWGPWELGRGPDTAHSHCSIHLSLSFFCSSPGQGEAWEGGRALGPVQLPGLQGALSQPPRPLPSSSHEPPAPPIWGLGCSVV